MDTVAPLQFILSFLFVLGLIGLMAMGLKRYGHRLQSGSAPMVLSKILGQSKLAGESAGRLAIVEVRYLDPRRKLVLVRRDDVEHLLLLADGRESVVESGITMKDER